MTISDFLRLITLAAIWGAIITALWTKMPLARSVVIGLCLGIVGVGVLVGWDAANIGEDAVIPIAAAIFAAFSYGIATNYAKNAPQVEAFDNAHGSMWASVIIILPLLPFIPLRESPSTDILTSVFLLGVVCTAFAYLLYFRLIADVGPSSALSVTFLIPVFGIFWGHVFLNEVIGLNAVLGSIMVIVGTMFVTGFSPMLLLRKKELQSE